MTEVEILAGQLAKAVKAVKLILTLDAMGTLTLDPMARRQLREALNPLEQAELDRKLEALDAQYSL